MYTVNAFSLGYRGNLVLSAHVGFDGISLDSASVEYQTIRELLITQKAHSTELMTSNAIDFYTDISSWLSAPLSIKSEQRDKSIYFSAFEILEALKILLTPLSRLSSGEVTINRQLPVDAYRYYIKLVDGTDYCCADHFNSWWSLPRRDLTSEFDKPVTEDELQDERWRWRALYDPYNIITTWFQMQQLTMKYVKNRKFFNVIENNEKVAQGIIHFFRNNPLLIPNNVSLNIPYINTQKLSSRIIESSQALKIKNYLLCYIDFGNDYCRKKFNCSLLEYLASPKVRYNYRVTVHENIDEYYREFKQHVIKWTTASTPTTRAQPAPPAGSVNAEYGSEQPKNNDWCTIS